MKREIGFWQLVGFFVVSIFGVFLHFLYDWTQNGVVALVSGVNESTWEHMKLLFFAMLFFALLEYPFFQNSIPAFWCIKLKGMLLGLLLIPVLFYTLSGVLGRLPDMVNISIFFVSVAVVFVYETRQLKRNAAACRCQKCAVAVLGIIAALFVLFTYFPPHIPLFADPVDGSFGITTFARYR